MKKIIFLVVVGLVFTALQVATVEAQELGVEPPPMGDPDMAPEGDHRSLPAPEDMAKFWKYYQEYQTNGVLSQASYDELSEAGYTKKRVDWILMTDHGRP